MPDSTEIQTYLGFSEETLKKAGNVLVSFRDSFQVKKTKDSLSLDIATSADYAAEELIVHEIKSHFPDHGILTEETSGYDTASDYRWIIDPLDGTKEYVRHSPYYYTLLALEYKGNLICGAGYQPEVKRMFLCGTDYGISVNGQKVSLSPEATLKKSFVSICLPIRDMGESLLRPYLRMIETLSSKTYRLRNTPWDVEALFNVSMGLVEAYILPPHELGKGPKLWDIAPGIAAIMANGGTLTDFQGKPINPRQIEAGIVATNGKIHTELLGIIRSIYR